MKFLIAVILWLPAIYVFAIPVDVELHNRPSSNATHAEIAHIAIKAIDDIKQYYSNNTLEICRPNKKVESDEDMVNLLNNKTIKKIKVSIYDHTHISMVASFNEVPTEVVIEVELKNNRCSDFFFFKSVIWIDPV